MKVGDVDCDEQFDVLLRAKSWEKKKTPPNTEDLSSQYPRASRIEKHPYSRENFGITLKPFQN